MIFLPHRSDENLLLRPRFDKPLHYFKDVTLEKDGFKFEETNEMEIKDNLPTCTRIYSLCRRQVAMNEMFVVYIEMPKESVTILLRDNLKFVENQHEIPNMMAKPHFISKEDFENDKKFKFYQFAKIIQGEKIKVRFEERVQKVLINGDQIIFMLRRKIVIFNMFSSSVVSLEDKIVDIALDRYLYVLTEKRILIYGEKLYKTLDIEKRCRNIVPTGDYIFLTRKSLIYRFDNPVSRDINEKDVNAIVYYVSIGHVSKCVSDGKYIYFTTLNTLNKMRIHDKELSSVSIHSQRMTVFLSENHIVLFDSNSGVMFIDKNTLSTFASKNYYVDLTGIAVYNNTIAYLCLSNLYIFEIEGTSDSVTIVPPGPNEKYNSNTISAIDESTYFHSDKGFKKIDVKTAKEVDAIYSNYTVNLPYKSIGMNAFYPKCKVFDRIKKFSVDKKIQSQIHEYENRRYEKRTSNDIDDLIFDFADNPIEILSKRSKRSEPLDYNRFSASLIPSPQMSQSDCDFSQKETIFSQNENVFSQKNTIFSQKDEYRLMTGYPNNITEIGSRNFINSYSIPEISSDYILPDEIKFKIKSEHLRMKRFIEKVKKKCIKHNISASKWDSEEDQSSDAAENGLFFDEPENKILNMKEHFILESIIGSSTQNTTVQTAQPSTIKMKKVFSRIFKRIPLEHPVLYSLPVEAVRESLHRKVVLSLKRTAYTASDFFVKNHFEFFKRRFQPKNTSVEEKPVRNGIYAFIQDEFKKIVGYQQTPNHKINVEETKQEPVKKKRGGF